MTETRTETDSLGTIDIPADRLWGPQTERARRLFRIGTERFPPGLIRAVGLQKRAAARPMPGSANSRARSRTPSSPPRPR
jgi:fumarate hydratase class II